MVHLLHWPRTPFSLPNTPQKEKWETLMKEPFALDSVKTYLATSRDGIHFNWAFLYAGLPLPLGARGLASGRGRKIPYNYVQTANQFVTHKGYHWVYYSANKDDHFNRWGGKESIWLAKYPADRFSGLAPIDESQGVVKTKPFIWTNYSIALVINIALGDGSSCAVELSSA